MEGQVRNSFNKFIAEVFVRLFNIIPILGAIVIDFSAIGLFQANMGGEMGGYLLMYLIGVTVVAILSAGVISIFIEIYKTLKLIAQQNSAMIQSLNRAD